MNKILLLIIPLFLADLAHSQSALTIKKIMQDPDWIGTSPDDLFWSYDSKKIYFDWNPENESGDSLYAVSVAGGEPQKVSLTNRKVLPSRSGDVNKDRTLKTYVKHGNLFLQDLKTGEIKRITNMLIPVHSPAFSHDEKQITFVYDNNLFGWDISSGHLTQLTNFKRGDEKEEGDEPTDPAEKWLFYDQIKHFEVLRKRKEEKQATKEMREIESLSMPKEIYIGDKTVGNLQLSPDNRFITYRLIENVNSKRTNVPNYVTETGFTENIPSRTKVGSYHSVHTFQIFDVERDTVYGLKTSKIPGINDQPEYVQEYAGNSGVKDNEEERKIIVHGPFWSNDGKGSFVEIKAYDNKDRWIMTLDVQDGSLKLLDRQRDEAWIGGPGIGWIHGSGDVGWMPDNKSVWFQSEESGYSHLYTVDVNSGKKKALTKGKFEVFDPRISKDNKHWYFTSSEVHPGERHFYKMPIGGGKAVQLTAMEGNNQVLLSPDEEWMAIRHSSSTKPWELYLQKNAPGAEVKQLTHSLSEAFKAYDWRVPELVTFKASDGAEVYARLYKPESINSSGPAVVFVHGAGYLQNAHKWWSNYFREYMFHNFLVDHGYTVLDIDYRGSAGYGRDWRTAIYRHMGGKDLTDQVDGARFLVDEHNIAADEIGIYGGSYGGFITLMAMFTQPGTFKAGAALRSVTDWAHYNHPYTSNILNTPEKDSLAYARSSPIYYADGLEGALLICHGMIDTNVHFQDVVRLTQRLIELGKENWELAVYPMEDHAFVEPSSWTDEYRRIFELFEENLKGKAGE